LTTSSRMISSMYFMMSCHLAYRSGKYIKNSFVKLSQCLHATSMTDSCLFL
jgi:hypothetical protein